MSSGGTSCEPFHPRALRVVTVPVPLRIEPLSVLDKNRFCPASAAVPTSIRRTVLVEIAKLVSVLSSS
jgi:hypothetical protein